ncbi:MAG: class II aldolase/adducin family protein [Pseudomonadales bacterium]|nr:class II aldolase/adducin family protein [Pseudomonadales bacterium]
MAEQSVDSSPSGFITRTPPVFDSARQERKHRIERLVGACRIFGKAGFSQGLLGHITVRDPEDPEHFWANPIGVSFNCIRVSDIVLVDHAGTLVQGSRPVNPVGVLLHSAIHRAYPEVTAVCHAHSIYGSAWSAFARPLDPLTQDTAIFFEDQAILREPRVAMDSHSADQFAAGFAGKRTGIQPGHGLFTTGQTVDEAAWRFVSMDRACQVQLLAEAAGTPELWPAEMAQRLKQSLGSPNFCWLSFQTLWDELVAEESTFLS